MIYKNLKKKNTKEAEDEKHADFVIYNTCTVRENANNKVYGRLGYLGSLKRKNPDMIIALCGCMMQEEHVREKIKETYRFVDLVFGTHNIFKFAELVVNAVYTNKQVMEVWDSTDKIVEELPIVRKYSFKSGINIMFGCNNFCSYCIVPYVRGRERSRKPEDIINEIKTLVEDGVTEIMLLGQNVNSYGKELENPMTFAELLSEITKIEGLKRIRFMTSHPKDLSDELIEVMASSDKICKHLHLPVQSGSTEILRAMNRKYTKEQYLTLVDKIRARIPDISLTTDIIVGFPGETEEDLQYLLDWLTEAQLDRVGCFQYSPVEGAPANELGLEPVPDEVKQDRWERFMAHQQAISAARLQLMVGKEIEVLIDEVDEQGAVGRSWADAPEIDGNVFVDSDELKPGDKVRVRITDADEYDLWAELV